MSGLTVNGPYPTKDPRRPFAVGAKTASGGMGYYFTFSHEDRAQEVADGLRDGTLNPRQVI